MKIHKFTCSDCKREIICDEPLCEFECECYECDLCCAISCEKCCDDGPRRLCKICYDLVQIRIKNDDAK